jgi:hypothetical protein
MITAQCTNTECREHGTAYNLEGLDRPVECGYCAQPCTTSDERPDPEMP